MGDVSDWHRKQRKKELHKNKTARVAARDAAVQATKTPQLVQDEIKQLQFKHKYNMSHAIQSKLDRLQKELKLVTQKAAAEKKATTTSTFQSDAHNKQPTFTPLDNPQISVYYDPILNPYGAAPPGKPMLYHRMGGGVTLHLHEAMGHEPPPQPPRQPDAFRGERNESSSKTAAAPAVQSSTQQSKPAFENKSRPEPERRGPSRPPPPPPLPKEQPPETPPPSPPRPVDPHQLPSLPQPSAAVQRSKMKRLLQADIWASNEEVEYEEKVVGLTLDGVDAATSSGTNNNHQWYYQDTHQQIQGPFAMTQMMEWVHAGFFPFTTMVRAASTQVWKPLGETVLVTTTTTHHRHHHDADKVEEVDVSVQDRIAALRQNGNEKSDSKVNDDVPTRVQELRSSLSEEVTEGNDVVVDTMPVPPPPPRPANRDELPSYPIVDDPDAYVPAPPYSVDNSMADVAYPVDDTYPDEYPAGDDSIPVTDDYPVTDAYPVIEEYPGAADDHGFVSDSAVVEPAKKKVKVDKAVVSMLPSHLQKRRMNKETSTKSNDDLTLLFQDVDAL